VKADAEPEAEIQIVRMRKGLRDRPFGYTVWIDDEAVGDIRDGGTQRYSVTPGSHGVRVGITGRFNGNGKFWTSKTRHVDVHGGETVTMSCRPASVTAVWDLARPNRRVQLSEPFSQE
jgi:hypothetical protein